MNSKFPLLLYIFLIIFSKMYGACCRIGSESPVAEIHTSIRFCFFILRQFFRFQLFFFVFFSLFSSLVLDLTRIRIMSSHSDLFSSVAESNYKRYGLHAKTDHDDDGPHTVPDRCEPIIARSSSFQSPSTSPTSRSRQSSPSHSPRLGLSRLSSSHRSQSSVSSGWSAWGFLRNWNLQFKPPQPQKGKMKVGKSWYRRKRVKGLLLLIGLLGSFFLVNWIMLTRLQDETVRPITELSGNSSAASVSVSVQVCA